MFIAQLYISNNVPAIVYYGNYLFIRKLKGDIPCNIPGDNRNPGFLPDLPHSSFFKRFSMIQFSTWKVPFSWVRVRVFRSPEKQDFTFLVPENGIYRNDVRFLQIHTIICELSLS